MEGPFSDQIVACSLASEPSTCKRHHEKLGGGELLDHHYITTEYIYLCFVLLAMSVTSSHGVRWCVTTHAEPSAFALWLSSQWVRV